MALSQTQSKFSFEFRDSNWVKGVIGVTPTNWSVHRSIHPAIGSKGCRCVFSWKWGGLLTQAKGVSQTKALFTVLLVLATEQNFKRTLFLCAVKFSLFWASTSWHGKDSPSAFCNLCFLCTSTSQRSPNRKKGEDLIVYKCFDCGNSLNYMCWYSKQSILKIFKWVISSVSYFKWVLKCRSAWRCARQRGGRQASVLPGRLSFGQVSWLGSSADFITCWLC